MFKNVQKIINNVDFWPKTHEYEFLKNNVRSEIISTIVKQRNNAEV